MKLPRLTDWHSLSSAPFYASALVILVLGLFIGLFWVVNEYQAYQESVDNIIKNYNKLYRERVKEEFDKVIDAIEYKRQQASQLTEQNLREKVQSAYALASHMYNLGKSQNAVPEMKKRALEILRPIRWNNGKGYYFVGCVGKRKISLFSDDPYYEGKGADEFIDGSGKRVLDDFIRIAQNDGAGLYRYNLLKPAFPGRSFPHIVFIKYFKPFDWFIGAGIYSSDLEQEVQKEVIERLHEMKFGNDGEVLGFRDDGTIIISDDDWLIGHSVLDLYDAGGNRYGREMLLAGTGRAAEPYIKYQAAGENQGRQKMNYVQPYPDWGWILSAGMSMDEMEKAIQAETDTYEIISFRNVFVFCVMFVSAVFLLLFAAYVYSRKIEQGIALFTEFFRKAADSKVKIQNQELTFTEFEVIGSLANRMVDDRIQKELILQRNERRIDTLLRLGEMEKFTLQEKYDFVLHRVIEITQSQGGYMALVNNAQTHLTLCSVVMDAASDHNIGFENGSMTGTVARSGLAGVAVSNKKPVMTNSLYSLGKLEPYRQDVFNHLDVPIYDGEKIVLVCGVCNRNILYDISDIRQMTLLLEGLWLHVLKTCSEKELANLERQVIAATQDERSRIGQDLHDGLASHLSGVELLSKALQQKLEVKAPEEAGQLGMIRGLIKEAIVKTSQLARGLYPVHLNEQGLQAALEEMIAEVETAFKSTRCTLSCTAGSPELDNNLATHLYYIIREAVFNGARHGKADNIRIKLAWSRDSYTISIKDDGGGFEQKTARKGMGLHTMKYRAKAVGANLVIESVAGSGTSVTITGEVE
ncbi:MAG: hypothetical protein CSB24_06905 [Deltaproteobacteria bacterium]|nr:MAG: hypothetical protein CSB24_06905 [Deltaproteobacteria bacterium]